MGRIWTQDRIARAINGLILGNVPTSGKKICRDKSSRTRAIIKKACGHPVNGRGLHDAAKRYFGNWTTALRVAGLKYESHCYWDKQVVINCIQELHQYGVSLRFTELSFDSSNRYYKILSKHSGKDSSGSALVNAGRRHFGTWKAAVEAAGIEYPQYIRPPAVKWKKSDIVKAILLVSKIYEDLRVVHLWGAEYKNFKVLIAEHFGRELSARKLYKNSKDEFGSWRKAIELSGLDPNRYIDSHYSNRKMFNIALVEYHIESHLTSDGRFERFITFAGSPLSGEEQLLQREFEEQLDSFIYSLPKKSRAFCKQIVDLVVSGAVNDIQEASQLAIKKHPSTNIKDAETVMTRLKLFLLDLN